MTADACLCGATPLARPVVTDLQDDPAGRSFTVRLEPGQELPMHRNGSRVVITAVQGTGVITIGQADTRDLCKGAVVQPEPNAAHGVVAGADGLVLLVALPPNCCGAC